jgi:hypothetical protein
MQFKTTQAQAAYQEILQETGRAIQNVLADAKALGERYPEAAVSIAVTASGRVADMSVNGTERAIRVGTEVDIQWSTLAGHMAICAGGN